jgi:hypothetical protein
MCNLTTSSDRTSVNDYNLAVVSEPSRGMSFLLHDLQHTLAYKKQLIVFDPLYDRAVGVNNFFSKNRLEQRLKDRINNTLNNMATPRLAE